VRRTAAVPVSRHRIALILALAAATVLGGCAVKKDMRYTESREIPPLRIPADLDTPAYTGVMAVPSPSADNASRVPADQEELRALERPPRRVQVPD
jgi:uncharacterized lipoprotein